MVAECECHITTAALIQLHLGTSIMPPLVSCLFLHYQLSNEGKNAPIRQNLPQNSLLMQIYSNKRF